MFVTGIVSRQCVSGHGSQVLKTRMTERRRPSHRWLRCFLCVVCVERPTWYMRLRHGFLSDLHVLYPNHSFDHFGFDRAVFCHTALSKVDSRARGNVEPLSGGRKGCWE